VWHIWWLAFLMLVCAYGVFVVFAWRQHEEYEIPADEVARIDARRREARQSWLERQERAA
jgi:cytochrome o ubiquinol oxidase subunit 1